MGTILAYVMQDAYTSGRQALLADFRRSNDVLRLLERGMRELDADRIARSTQPVE